MRRTLIASLLILAASQTNAAVITANWNWTGQNNYRAEGILIYDASLPTVAVTGSQVGNSNEVWETGAMLRINHRRNGQPADPEDVVTVTDPGMITLSVTSGPITFMSDGTLSGSRPGAIAFCDPIKEAEPRKIVLTLPGSFYIAKMDESECDMHLE